MIKITKNQANRIVLTLTEKTTVTPVYYLFEFINQTTYVKQYIVMPDLSIHRQRYNEFELVEGTDLTFDYTGHYVYVVYQQTNDTNLDPDSSDGEVERGQMKVFGVDPTNYKYDGQTKTNIVYNG